MRLCHIQETGDFSWMVLLVRQQLNSMERTSETTHIGFGCKWLCRKTRIDTTSPKSDHLQLYSQPIGIYPAVTKLAKHQTMSDGRSSSSKSEWECCCDHTEGTKNRARRKGQRINNEWRGLIGATHMVWNKAACSLLNLAERLSLSGSHGDLEKLILLLPPIGLNFRDSGRIFFKKEKTSWRSLAAAQPNLKAMSVKKLSDSDSIFLIYWASKRLYPRKGEGSGAGRPIPSPAPSQ